MNIVDFDFKSDFDKQCGEIFLTVKGKMMFHCTLCENIYKGYAEYADHVTLAHILESEIAIDQTMAVINENSTNTDTDESVNDPNGNELTLVDGIDREMTNPEDGSSIFCTDTKEESNKARETTKREVESKPNIKEKSDPPKKRRYKRRSNTTERVYNCSFCNFSCNDRSNLLSHERRHLNQRPHQCHECNKRFYTRTELKTHVRTHTGERPFLCTFCGRSFKTSGMLSDHVKRHEDFRNKECNICGRKFFNKDMLRKHLATHSEERPYKCSSCESSFKQANGLRNHKKIHENKREYQCTICSARFNQNPGLHSHMKTKHFLRPPLCMEAINKNSTDRGL